MTLTGSGMLLTLRHYIGFHSYAVDVLRYVALNVVNLRCLVVIHWSFQCHSQQCGILTSVDSDKPVQPHFKLRNSKCCLVSRLTFIEYSSD